MKLLASKQGNMSTIMAVMSLALIGAVGVAVDVSVMFSQSSAMKKALESGLLAAAREAPVVGWDETKIKSIVDRYVAENLQSAATGSATYTLSVTPDAASGRIAGRIEQRGHGYFVAGLFRQDPQLAVDAEALLVSSANTCVLTLDPSSAATLAMTGNAQLSGSNCGIFANSNDVKAIDVDSGSRITSVAICSAGGVDYRAGDLVPSPQTDCPPQPDPLAGRAPPVFGGCNHTNLQINYSTSLNPGVYCGGLKIIGNSDVTLNPGVYVIKDGEFKIDGNAELSGTGVGFFVTGPTAKISFGTATSVSLTAPTTGPLAGILFYEDRNSPEGREFLIESKDAGQLIGAIYLPKGYLLVKNTPNFAEGSAWTAVIAREVRAEEGATLKFNSNYSASAVPVPAGIAGASAIRLVE